MNWADNVNGLFEFLGALFILLNVRQILKDKQVLGVSILPTMIYTLWGFWNLYYYPYLNQWVSFFSGIGVVLGNLIWVILALKYRGKKTDAVEA